MKIIGINIIIVLLALSNTASANQANSSDTPVQPDIIMLEKMLDNPDMYIESAPLIEDWMLAEISSETEMEPTIENWMLKQPNVIEEMEPVIEDWMLESPAQIGELEPVIEDWMLG